MSDQAPEILLAHHLKALKLPTCLRENGGAIFGHASGGIVLLRAA